MLRRRPLAPLPFIAATLALLLLLGGSGRAGAAVPQQLAPTSTFGPTTAPARTATPLTTFAPTATLGPTLTPRVLPPAATSTLGARVTPPIAPTSTLGPTRAPTLTPTLVPGAPTATVTRQPTQTAASPTAPGATVSAGIATVTPTATATATTTATATATASPTPVTPFVVVGQPLSGWTVVVDPGHGGRDPGALYHGLRESDVNLAISLAARPMLEAAGARVVLTRDRDVLVGPADGSITEDLEARAQIANRAGARLFVSVHANVHTDPDVAGAIAYYGQESGYAGGQRRAPRQVELSWFLADAIERGVTGRTGEVDRGVRTANFWVLGATTMPSVLLESGFLTNEAEAARLGDPAFQRRIAEGVTYGVIGYATGGQVLPTDRVPSLAGPTGSGATPNVRYYDATGHNLAFGFKSFFDSHGGLDIFGYPRTEELVEGGWTVQYFQRARFEFHPEHAGTPYEVQLGLLGDDVTAARRPFPPGGAFPSDDQHRWYPETAHGVHYAFLQYFDTHGGLDVFGYPISEELYGENGWPYAVQYFQRARFEYHPEHAGTPYEVQLGLLGDQTLVDKRWLR